LPYKKMQSSKISIKTKATILTETPQINKPSAHAGSHTTRNEQKCCTFKSACHENVKEDRTIATDRNRLGGHCRNQPRESSARHERFVPIVLRRTCTLRGMDKRPRIRIYLAS